MEILAENMSVVNKSELLLEKRMDPEYYQPEFINIIAKLHDNNTLCGCYKLPSNKQ